MNYFSLITALSIFSFLFSCNLTNNKLVTPDQKVNQKTDAFPLEMKLSDELPIETKLAYDFSENVYYDDAHARNTFDILIPQSDTPTPLVIYIHGGGFTSGDKKGAYIPKIAQSIRTFLQNGVAFATINYRFLEHSEEGVITSLKDCQRFVQFIRYYADDLNIDKTRIASYGTSAGGGAGLWLGTHDDFADMDSDDPIARESSRLKAVVAINTQSTYDILKWEEVFAGYNIDLKDPNFSKSTLFNLYNVNDYEELVTPQMQTYRTEVDMLNLISADDATLYVKNSNPKVVPQETKHLLHHAQHATALAEAAEAVGLIHYIADSQRKARKLPNSTDFLLEALDR